MPVRATPKKRHGVSPFAKLHAMLEAERRCARRRARCASWAAVTPGHSRYHGIKICRGSVLRWLHAARQICPESERAGKLAAFRDALEPVRATLGKQPFLGGEQPLYTDIIVFSFFMWARSVSRTQILDADDPVHAWRERMLDAFGGAGRRAVGFAA